MTIRISGITARNTVYTVAPADGRTRLVVHVHTGEADHAIACAVLLVGIGHAAQAAAANAAHHMRKGQRITVYGDGLALEHGHLVVRGCNSIRPDNVVALRHLEGSNA